MGSQSDTESAKEKRPFPWYVVCFLGNEFCERFAYYGMRAILIIYLSSLGFDDDAATAIYHAFVMGAYAWPLLGSALADGYFGRYKVILWFSVLYVIGMLVQSFSALPFLSPDDGFKTTNAIICLLALFLIGLGTGGIKPCVSTMGGDQFEDDDEKGREFFFNLFYISINVGSLISEFITPKIRGISCGSLGIGDNCFFIAFLIPAILMGVALLAFVAGTKWYIVKPPAGDNIFWLHLKCIHYGVWGKKPESAKNDENYHFLDKAQGQVPQWVIRDMKYFMPMIWVLLPQPIFWCCYDQSGSRWVLQALKMNGWIGDSILVLADQIVILNGAMIILFVPLFSWTYGKIDAIFRSCLSKSKDWKFCTELRKWGTGYFMLSLAFVVAAAVQSKIDSTITVYPTYDSEISLRVVNAMGSDVIDGKFLGRNPEIEEEINEANESLLKANYNIMPGFYSYFTENQENSTLSTGEILIPTNENIENIEELYNNEPDYSFSYNSQNKNSWQINNGRFVWNLALIHSGMSVSYPGWAEKNENGKNFITIINGAKEDVQIEINCDSSQEGSSHCEPLTNITVPACTQSDEINSLSHLDESAICVKGYSTKISEDLMLLTKGSYTISINGKEQNHIEPLVVVSGGSYTLVIPENFATEETSNVNVITDITSNDVQMGWIIPQYAVLTIAEVLFVTTGYIFCYEQAPPSLKSVVQAYLLLCSAVGQIFIIIVAESKLFPNQTIEYLFFAGVALVGMILNVIMSLGYKYVDNSYFFTDEYKIEGLEPGQTLEDLEKENQALDEKE